MYLAPFSWGVLFYPPKDSVLELSDYFLRYAWFLILFIAWTGLRILVRTEQLIDPKKSQRSAKQKKLGYLKLLLVTVPVLGSLQPFKDNFGEITFYLALTVMMLTAMSDSLEIRGYLKGAILVHLTAVTGVAFLSFQPALPFSIWQPFALSFSIGVILAAQRGASFLVPPKVNEATVKDSSENRKKLFTGLSRLVTILLMLAPIPFALLVFMRQEKQLFLLPLILFFFTLRLAQGLRQAEEVGEVTKELKITISSICLLSVVIFTAVALLSLY